MFYQFLIVALMIPLATSIVWAADQADPYLWLEEIDATKSLDWAKKQNKTSIAQIEAVPEFAEIHKKNLEIYNSQDRIPSPAIRGAWTYNFWQDAQHVRGIWRRTFLEEFVQETPKWETVLDLDVLAEEEGENWVWKGVSYLQPEYRHCLVALSRGGGDAVVRRELDTVTKAFVADGFTLPEAKSDVSWKDADTLWVGTDFGEGSLTTSGYPRFAKKWKRGSSLEDAQTVFEGSVDDVSAGAVSLHTPEGRYDLVFQSPEFFRGVNFLMLGDRLVKLDLPDDANLHGFFKDQMLVSLRSDWTVSGATYAQDSLLAIELSPFLRGRRDFQTLFEPSERVSLGQVSWTLNRLLISTLDNVRGRLFRLSLADQTWSRDEIDLPGFGTVGIGSASNEDDKFFFTYTDFLTPSSLYLVDGDGEPKRVKTAPAFFDPEGMQVAQHEAVSADGTRIPYFMVMPQGFEADGTNPTLLYGYGGFEIPLRPSYSATIGSAWLQRGGVYVLANIRGGGEFGPKWHQAALQENRQRAFDDFIAVAEDLIARKITSPAHLGIQGGSNGGLLVGAVFTQRPELFGAVVCQVPLLDMRRYNQLLAGASWMAEYGDPDKPEDWAYIKTWSPYHNLKEGVDYPEVFFLTSTRDDRVHPGHARKMVAKMTGMGHPVYYYENIEGGHGGAANLKQRAYMSALAFAYLWKMLR